MQEGIIHVLTYFSVFSYPPDLAELHMFLPTSMSREQLLNEIKNMEQERKVITKNNRYTLSEHARFFDIYEKRSALSKLKRNNINGFIITLSKYPGIKSIGVTGSVSMLNAEDDGDVDLCIIAESGRIWTARLISLLIAQTFGIRRKHTDTKFSKTICLNLFFDKQHLEIPDVKKNEYVGHELLQMKKIYDVDQTFNRLIYSNEWVFDLFPNAQRNEEHREGYCHSGLDPESSKNTEILHSVQDDNNNGKRDIIGDLLEYVAKHLQLFFIRKHTTTERISDKQLWFFPDDFQKKLEKKVEITSL